MDQSLYEIPSACSRYAALAPRSKRSGIARSICEKCVHVAGLLRIQRDNLDCYCLQVVAEDVDSKPNGAVLYSIIAGNQGNQFSIDPISGIIRVNKELDRETVCL